MTYLARLGQDVPAEIRPEITSLYQLSTSSRCGRSLKKALAGMIRYDIILSLGQVQPSPVDLGWAAHLLNRGSRPIDSTVCAQLRASLISREQGRDSFRYMIDYFASIGHEYVQNLELCSGFRVC